MKSSTMPIGQKQMGRLGHNRMSNTNASSPNKRAPTATTSKAIGKYGLSFPIKKKTSNPFYSRSLR